MNKFWKLVGATLGTRSFTEKNLYILCIPIFVTAKDLNVYGNCFKTHVFLCHFIAFINQMLTDYVIKDKVNINGKVGAT